MDSKDIYLDATLPNDPRCTAHILAVDNECLLRTGTPGPYGSLVHISPNSATTPPPVLFGAVYASAVLANFASPNVKQDLMDRWSDTLYPRGEAGRRETEENRNERHADERSRRRKSRRNQDGPDGLDMLAMFPYLGIPKYKLPKMLKEIDAQKKAEEHKRVEEKVNNWRDNLGIVDNINPSEGRRGEFDVKNRTAYGRLEPFQLTGHNCTES